MPISKPQEIKVGWNKQRRKTKSRIILHIEIAAHTTKIVKFSFWESISNEESILQSNAYYSKWWVKLLVSLQAISSLLGPLVLSLWACYFCEETAWPCSIISFLLFFPTPQISSVVIPSSLPHSHTNCSSLVFCCSVKLAETLVLLLLAYIHISLTLTWSH